jgi:hypothetical protein
LACSHLITCRSFPVPTFSTTIGHLNFRHRTRGLDIIMDETALSFSAPPACNATSFDGTLQQKVYSRPVGTLEAFPEDPPPGPPPGGGLPPPGAPIFVAPPHKGRFFFFLAPKKYISLFRKNRGNISPIFLKKKKKNTFWPGYKGARLSPECHTQISPPFLFL